MASTDRALLANVDVFLAEGNIRRAISGFANNMLAQTANGSFQERRLDLLRNTTEVLKSVSGNKATILRVSKPVKVMLNFLPSTAQVALYVTSLYIYTGEVGDLTIINESTTVDSKVSFLQI